MNKFVRKHYYALLTIALAAAFIGIVLVPVAKALLCVGANAA